jgi:SpoIIAA-like
MITISHKNTLLKINVFGELTLDDYRELEQSIIKALESGEKIRLLFDLTTMSGFTVDVAWEDVKFVGAHTHDFERIAIVSNDQWLSWVSWINAAFTDAETRIFDSADEAMSWIQSD